MNKDVTTVNPEYLVLNFSHMKYEEVKEWVPKADSQIVNNLIWNAIKSESALVKEVNKVVGIRGKVTSKLICFWAIKAFKNNSITQVQKDEILEKAAPEKKAAPVEVIDLTLLD